MAYGYSIQANDTRGLDPRVYVVNIGVHRLDGEALTEEELALIAAALTPEARQDEGNETPSKATGTEG